MGYKKKRIKWEKQGHSAIKHLGVTYECMQISIVELRIRLAQSSKIK
jgi:hypothetical protein